MIEKLEQPQYEILKDEKVRVIIPWDVHQAIKAIVREVKTEVAGWAEAEVVEGVIVLTRVAVPEQEASGGHAYIDGSQTLPLHANGELDITKAIVSWHSHVGMSAFASGTDEEAYRNLSSMMPLVVGLVTNKNDDWWSRVFVKTPWGGIELKPKLLLAEPPEAKEINEWAKEMAKRVQPPRATYDRRKWSTEDDADLERYYADTGIVSAARMIPRERQVLDIHAAPKTTATEFLYVTPRFDELRKSELIGAHFAEASWQNMFTWASRYGKCYHVGPSTFLCNECFKNKAIRVIHWIDGRFTRLCMECHADYVRLFGPNGTSVFTMTPAQRSDTWPVGWTPVNGHPELVKAPDGTLLNRKMAQEIIAAAGEGPNGKA